MSRTADPRKTVGAFQILAQVDLRESAEPSRLFLHRKHQPRLRTPSTPAGLTETNLLYLSILRDFNDNEVRMILIINHALLNPREPLPYPHPEENADTEHGDAAGARHTALSSSKRTRRDEDEDCHSDNEADDRHWDGPAANSVYKRYRAEYLDKPPNILRARKVENDARSVAQPCWWVHFASELKQVAPEEVSRSFKVPQLSTTREPSGSRSAKYDIEAVAVSPFGAEYMVAVGSSETVLCWEMK